jgi:aromatic ring-opening dioxygenase catalytic subunit (LigB family)
LLLAKKGRMMDGMSEQDSVTRRQVIGAGVVGAATLGVAGIAAGHGSPGEALPGQSGASTGAAGGGGSSSGRMPVVYLPHGGGPWPFVDLGMPEAELRSLRVYLEALAQVPKTRPKALLVISAHWEERVPTVTTSERPPMLYDYFGFPPAAYTVTWPAAGDPALAARVRELLQAAGIESASDPKRGFDHGTFVPLKLTYPGADIPTVQLSLQTGLAPEKHLAIGRAIAKLRDEGVLILGSGMSYHNMRGFFDQTAVPPAVKFDAWLRESTCQEQAKRDQLLTDWAKSPAARDAHPREEHLLPLMVIAGAAGGDRASVAFQGSLGSKPITAFHFG